MPQYLMTLDELKGNALEDLGLMTEGSYDEFMSRATAVASSHDVARPRLVIGLVYNDEKKNLVGIKETPYPISSDEWAVFVSQIEEYLESAPRIYVVDGDQFTAPI